MDNAKQIPSVFLDYIPPLAGVDKCASIPCEFEYTLITVYIPKGICIVGPQLGHIPALKNNEFNLRDRKNYMMIVPYWYLMNMTGKNLRIVSQLWIKDITQSMILNVMNIPHFGRHQEVNACVKLLLSYYHGGYMWLDKSITMDSALIHLIIRLNMQGLDP